MSGGTRPPPPDLVEAHAQTSVIVTWTPLAVIMLVFVVTVLWRWRASVLARRATDNAAFEHAFGSDNLDVLGAYLRDQLGALRLDAFADSEEVRDRTRKYLGRLREYLNRPQPPSPAQEAAAQFEAMEDTGTAPTVEDSTTIIEAQSLIAENKGWSAFALLRRELERALRSKGLIREKQSLPPPSSIEPKNLQAAYGIFLRTANCSIHGEDISADEEERAVKAAKFLFERLDEINLRTIDRTGDLRPNSAPSS